MKMSLEDENDIKRILATYFLKDFDKSLTLQKCIVDTGISKSAIYSFFSEAGFKSFKLFLRAILDEKNLLEYDLNKSKLKKENYFNEASVKELLNMIKKSKSIYFYGNQEEIDLFKSSILLLIQKGHNVKNINVWNLEYTNNILDYLKSDDILIIVDTNYRLSSYYDMATLNSNIIDMNKINSGNYHKFYIGKRNIDDTSKKNDFNIIHIEKGDTSTSHLGLLHFDRYLSFLLKESE